jgi:hypothetical protein
MIALADEMKNKLLERGLSYFFTLRIHGKGPGNIFELLRPDTEAGRSKSVLENILRWADEGGQMLGPGSNTIDPPNPAMAWEQENE